MINVTVIKPEVSYPKLRIYEPNTECKYMIVLFTNKTCGIKVKQECNSKAFIGLEYSDIGLYSKNWVCEYFTDYEGEVILNNHYSLMYNNKNIIMIVGGSEKSNGDATGFVLNGENIFSLININKADYKVFDGSLILKNI